jgi:hypothetical protein
MIGFNDTLYTQLGTKGNYSIIADFYTLQFTVTHTLVSSVISSRIFWAAASLFTHYKGEDSAFVPGPLFVFRYSPDGRGAQTSSDSEKGTTSMLNI